MLEQKQIKALTPTGEKNINKTREQIEEMLGVYLSEKAIWDDHQKEHNRLHVEAAIWNTKDR